MMRMPLGGGGHAQDDRRDRQVPQQVLELAERPRRVQVLRREQPADVGVEVLEAEVQHDQREQEIRYRQADEADEGEDVVEDASTGASRSRCRSAAPAAT